jgi:FkbM family methyltransferase
MTASGIDVNSDEKLQVVFRPAFSPASCYILRNQEEATYFTQYGGAPEAKLIDWATQLVQAGQSFIDVGAHVGSWAQHFAQKCRRVDAFEPQRTTYDRLREGVRLAGLANVNCHDVALGASGEVDLHVVSIDGGGSTLLHRGELGPDLTTERVRAAQLDDYVFDDVGLIKIDAEGAEGNILRGALKTLEAHRYPTLLLEAWLHEWYAKERAALIAQVEGLGYRVQPVANCPEMLLAEHPARRSVGASTETELSTSTTGSTAGTTARPLLGLVMIGATLDPGPLMGMGNSWIGRPVLERWNSHSRVRVLARSRVR